MIWAKIALFIAIFLGSHTQAVIPMPIAATSTPAIVHIKEQISAPVQVSAPSAPLQAATSTYIEPQATGQIEPLVIPNAPIVTSNPDPVNSYQAEGDALGWPQYDQ